jgi:hypothetical protein
MFGDRRKGEGITIRDSNDKTTRAQRQRKIKEESKNRFFNIHWQREAIRVIKDKIKHLKAIGKSPFKLQVYKSKLKTQSNLLEKLGGLLVQ